MSLKIRVYQVEKKTVISEIEISKSYRCKKRETGELTTWKNSVRTIWPYQKEQYKNNGYSRKRRMQDKNAESVQTNSNWELSKPVEKTG